MKQLSKGIILALLWTAGTGVPCLQAQPAGVAAPYTYTNAPLIDVIRNIQNATPYRFLYRESMITDIKISLHSNAGRLFSDLDKELQPHGIDLKVDSVRKQAILFRSQSKGHMPGQTLSISGQTVDAATGERLPFATLFWREQNRLRGVSSNSAGAFTIEREVFSDTVTLNATYVGYKRKSVMLDVSNRSSFSDLSLRLEPERINATEVVITGTDFYVPADTTLRSVIDLGMHSPLGETNSLRALQMLPAVGLSPALGGAINIRGSDNDGLQVLLDGITIYKQSHLFGLLDSFNSDALKTSGFFYGIAPAQYQAPPGGTLSLFTKTGSLHEIGGTAGISNSTWRVTLEGPIKKGSSSWLFSGRSSYMNSINWLNNSDLIEWGLDVNRPRELLSGNMINVESRIVRPLQNDAHFIDLHGKFYFENKDGNRLIISSYYGFDNTLQESDRLFRSFDSSDPDNTKRVRVETKNEWGNFTGSAQYQASTGRNSYSFTSLGWSVYETDFSKDDFTYTRYNPDTQSFQSFTYPFANRSILNEFKVSQQFDFTLSPILLSAGATYQYFLGEYFEESFDRPGYFSGRTAHKIDLFTQADFTDSRLLHLFAGNRVTYFNAGDYLKWSPRLQVKLFPEAPVTLAGGFSRNQQFLSQISLSNVVSSEVWVLANDNQPPTTVDYVTAGIYLKPVNNHFLQVEAYSKHFDHIRLHEINSFSLANTFGEAPWFVNNSGYGRGIEFLLHNTFGFLTLNQSFSISRMELENPLINEGEPFLADWDRTYNYSATVSAGLLENLSLNATWIYATGTPNKLAVFGPENQQRLGDYYRTDITAEFFQRTSFGRIDASISVFNLFDRENPWYRELAFVFDRNFSPGRFRTVPVNVYDLGFQPSFNLSVSF